ncbi:pilus assembly protein [Tessaracoccus sp. HDW20]|nr:pilus assembly protein [Tessaracoccus coleopterorum]
MIVIPATLLIISAIIMAGRLALANQAIQAVAYDTARAASVARDRAAATSDANRVAGFTLASNGLSCLSTTINVDTSGFERSAGQAATVTTTVTCTLPLGDLSLPGYPEPSPSPQTHPAPSTPTGSGDEQAQRTRIGHAVGRHHHHRSADDCRTRRRRRRAAARYPARRSGRPRSSTRCRPSDLG